MNAIKINELCYINVRALPQLAGNILFDALKMDIAAFLPRFGRNDSPHKHMPVTEVWSQHFLEKFCFCLAFNNGRNFHNATHGQSLPQ